MSRTSLTGSRRSERSRTTSSPEGSASPGRTSSKRSRPCGQEVNRSDPAWLTVDTPDYSIEFNLGADDPIDHFALHVRGGGPIFEAVARFLDALSVRAIDVQDETGLFDAQRAIQSFSDWADYRDSVTDDRFA